ncbi:MAG: ABC transporter ATP-binding protein [Anaerolineales bacterium]|nr:ABC transporter ATP-binding protein [Anaerolineales bacterium]
MTPIVAFERVSKRYVLRHDRPRSARAVLLQALRPRSAPLTRETLWALQEASFEVRRGETVALIGPNGAGKSTALKLISRVIVPTAGCVRVAGRVAALLELGTGFHPDLSGRDNVFLSGALIGMDRDTMRRKFDAIVEFSELADFIDVPVKHYSSGMFARLAFAVSIHLDPDVLLVDEVLAVGDQAFQLKCLDRIAQLQAADVTICLVSHSLDTVRSVCRRALWFDHGRVRADGPVDSVVLQYQAYATEQEAARLDHFSGGPASQRWGTRRLEITAVRILDGRGQPSSIFATGEPLVIEMDYDAHGPVEAPLLGLAVHRQDGVHVTGPNTGTGGLRLPRLEGRGTVAFSVPALPLLNGLYLVSVAAVSQDDGETYDYHSHQYAFRVANPSDYQGEHYGLMTLGGGWKVGRGA